jgi:hypothetical protein
MEIGRDIGFDQIVPLEKNRQRIYFCKGLARRHRTCLLIANEDNTEIYLDGTLFRTLNRGEYAIRAVSSLAAIFM